jgi:hypothetical protein
MEKLYYNLVLNHLRTCNPDNRDVKQVPSTYFHIVLAMLKENGYDADGNAITE